MKLPTINFCTRLFIILCYLSFSVGHAKPELSKPLSKEEQSWVKRHPHITIGVDPDWAPFEYINQQGQVIQRQWIAVNYEQKIDYTLYAYTSLAVLLFILLILLWNWRLSTEVKARKVAEAALYESQKILQYKNNILELLSKGSSLKIILESLITHLESSHPEMIGSVLLLDKQKKHLNSGVAINLPEHYMQAIDGIKIGLGAGSCGTAAFTGEQVIVENIMTHPYWEGFQELARSAGVSACWSQPIISSCNEILGTFAIY
ncbi:MAG: GAF domain-containing protein, partial [Methyloprofundus sp.]|nr:GAF domain-containing protein [Methyloprofundus sp.]